MLFLSTLSSFALLAGEAAAYFSYNELANTPQMGWVSHSTDTLIVFNLIKR